jgi:hypothetical protein
MRSLQDLRGCATEKGEAMSDKPEKRTLFHGAVPRMAIELQESEMTLLMVEALTEADSSQRPTGKTAAELLDILARDNDDRMRKLVADCHRCTTVAIHYFARVIAESGHGRVYDHEGEARQ